ncbi:MAG: IS5 family transposase [candidate division WOR-3 bacterium]
MFTKYQKEKMTWGQFEAERRLPEDHFLMRINALIDFSPIEKALSQLYSDRTGRPSYPPLVLLKICLLQRFYDLSDLQVVQQLRYNFLFMKFVGLRLEDEPPDDTTLVKFRDRIAERKILDHALEYINSQLESKGLLLKQGAVIDATLVPAAVGPKATKKDPDARTTLRKKANGRTKIVHGYNVGTSVDKRTGLILKVVVEPANVHDTHLFDPLMLDWLKEVYGDKGFSDERRRRKLRERGIAARIMFKGTRGKKLSNIEHYHNKRWAKTRYIVEQTIAGLKRCCGLRRMMWMGLSRAQLQAELSAIAFNCKRAISLLQA